MSDQDFFFDEEGEASAPPAKDSSTTGAKSTPASAPRSPARQAAATSPAFFEQSVSMMVAALMTVVGLLVGVIVGFVLAPGGTVGGGAISTGTQVPAPQLSPEQLESGDLPPGHPAIGEAGGADEATDTAPADGDVEDGTGDE